MHEQLQAKLSAYQQERLRLQQALLRIEGAILAVQELLAAEMQAPDEPGDKEPNG
jgi:hypothetical protein